MLRDSVLQGFPDRARQAMRVEWSPALVEWSPALVGLGFLVLFLARLPRLIEHVYWDSDAASATVIAQTFGHGTVILERFGWFTTLWFELLTRPLPLHRQLWEGAPYAFALASVALLAWASWRLGGRWAAAMTATAAVATSPFVSYDVVTVNYHTATWAVTAILAVFCFWVARQPSAGRFAFAAVLVTLLAGTTLASDWLFAFVGLVPYAGVGVLLATVPRRRAAGGAVIVSASLAVLIAWATTWGMRVADVKVFAVPARFADAKELGPNFGRLIEGIVQLVNGDYFYGAQLGVRSTLSLACAVLVLLALAAPFILTRRNLRTSASVNVPLLVYSSFWASCVALNCAGFVLSSEGTHGGYYLVPILYATAATVPLLLNRTRRTRLIASAAIAIVAVTSLINLADSATALSHPLPPVASVADQIVERAREAHALKGYADYWDASSLTWSERMAIQVAPASQCAISQAKTDLCGYWFNANTHWYQPLPGNTFVLLDKQSNGLRQRLPDSYGAPTATYQLSKLITMYIYPYDVAKHFIWVPSP